MGIGEEEGSVKTDVSDLNLEIEDPGVGAVEDQDSGLDIEGRGEDQ